MGKTAVGTVDSSYLMQYTGYAETVERSNISWLEVLYLTSMKKSLKCESIIKSTRYTVFKCDYLGS